MFNLFYVCKASLKEHFKSRKNLAGRKSTWGNMEGKLAISSEGDLFSAGFFGALDYDSR